MTDGAEFTVEQDVQRARSRRPSTRVILTAAAAAVVLAVIVWLATLRWLPPHASPVATAILNTVIIGGPIPVVLNVLAAVGVLFLLIRRPTRRRVIVAAIAVVAGSLIALVVFWVSTATNAFGLTLSNVIGAWTVVAFASVALALVSFRGARPLRRAGNVVVILIVVLAAIVGINGNFGLDPTIASLAGVSTQPTIVLPLAGGGSGAGSSTAPPVWSTWTPPADMPTVGRTAQVHIPPTISGFVARPAGLYLPPAALTRNPPRLPLVIMMMGQPGNPDPSFQAQVLDRIAARNKGLAPIVIVADQIGDPSVDTLCLDTKEHGNAQTYITRDVVGWARAHLHIDQDAAHWVIAGYSNGGECAAQLGAKYPNIWGNVIDISGEEYEGWQLRSKVVASVFHGNWSAYSATWPRTVLAAHRYPDSHGVFVVASDDPIFKPQTVAIEDAARAAHWTTTFHLVENAGHGVSILLAGLKDGYSDLSARLGLSQPAN